METHAGIAAHTGQASGEKKGDSIKSVKQMHSCTILVLEPKDTACPKR